MSGVRLAGREGGREQPGRAGAADVRERLEALGERQVHEAVAAQHQVGLRQRVADQVADAVLAAGPPWAAAAAAATSGTTSMPV